MKRKVVAGMAAAIVGVGRVTAPVAGAKERLLTLYSPKIDSLPYVHDTHNVALRADGREAPAKPGYILGFKEMALVDSKDPKAKPLPIAKMMVHHFLYFAPGRVNEGPAAGWGAGFIGGRGEEHPLGRFAADPLPPSARKVYGIKNRRDRRRARLAPHRDGDEPLQAPEELLCAHEGLVHDREAHAGDADRHRRLRATSPTAWRTTCPAAGGRARTSSPQATGRRRFDGRMLVGASHQHGGGKYQTLESRTCKRRLYKAPVYYGPPDHPYNTIRPILHEPGPIGNGTFATAQGIPITGGEVLRRTAVHDNHNLHVASMGFWST